MAFVNFATREITAKIVYYGPGLGGKTTSLQYIHNGLPADNRGKMISLATEEDRTIYFDFLPLHLGKIQDFAVRVQLYTVPGQVRYNATRKLVLRGADGLVFVADAQRHKKLSNLESFNNMEENLREHGKELRDLPHVLQFNKIDLPGRMSAEDLNILVNKYNAPHFETCATSGTGVLDSLKCITKHVFNDLGKKALLQKKSKTVSGPAPAQYLDKTFKEPGPPVAAPVTPAPAYLAESEYNDKEISGVGKDRELEHNYPGLDLVEPKVTPPAGETANRPVLEEETHAEVEFDEVSDEESIEDYSIERNEISEIKREEYFSYQELFYENSEFQSLLDRLEKQISENQGAGAIITARAAYSLLIKNLFPKEYVFDGNESSMILALNMKFKRFIRFKRLLASESLHASELLFLHHFLCDLYLSIKEL